jgi:hypothetical protein
MPSAGECVSPGDLLLISVEVEVGGKAGTSRIPWWGLLMPFAGEWDSSWLFAIDIS